MKTSLFRLILPVVTILSISSCVDPMYGGGYGSNSGSNSGYRGSYNSYSTLPQGYSGNAYLYNGRYYSGGQYQTGHYSYQGRNYDSRYHHNGQYYYGGSHAHYPGDGHDHGSPAPQQYPNRDQSSYQGYQSSSNRYYR